VDFSGIPVARSFQDRLFGLMGKRDDLFLFIPRCRSIHTWFMRSAIDVVFVDEAGVVVSVARRVAPWRMVFGPGNAEAVLELPPDHARALKAGDKLCVPSA
jgi:uncharacterized membrane protein (UPF0127 family)